MQHYLIVIIGPTGIGKTKLSIDIAQAFHSPIISADSRQIYNELKIGTAAPTQDELAQVQHYMIGNKSLFDYYNAWQFEQDVLTLTNSLFNQHNPLILTGGSMMYVDAVCKGIDELPTIDTELRNTLQEQYNQFGLDTIRHQLKKLDPIFYDQVDLKNHKRVIHALEVCLMTGKPYSSLRTNTAKCRPFKTIKIGLNMDREELYNRINRRVDKMIEEGLIEEAKTWFTHRHMNSLNTVGYKELFDFFDGSHSLDFAIELIKRNSRRYAKRQLSWFNRDKEISWFHPQESESIMDFITKKINEQN